uniref:Uncharacterized protein n=2 Tax=Emiliania huxleyi TaxID=2903 RepID=A0A7S3W0S6_EMIHU
MRPGCSTTAVAVNSLDAYAAPREWLLASLRRSGVPMDQVHVFLAGRGYGEGGGDSGVVRRDGDGVRYYAVPHNSIDFSAMVHIVENPLLFGGVRQWFYLHDTAEVGRGFWPNVTHWCDRLPTCALPLTRYYPSSSMGLYDAAFLAARRADIVRLKNARGAPAETWKRRGFGWEDKVIKLCDASGSPPPRRFTRRCYNKTLLRRTCICSSVHVESTPAPVYADSTPRQVWRFDCADVRKFKANFERNRTLVLAP